MRFRIVAASLATVLATAVSAWAAPFVNGSFEASSCVPPEGSFSTLTVGQTCITGWTVVQSDIDYIHDYWEASDPDKSLDLNGDQGAGGIQQTFDTLSGHSYQVSFDLAGNPDGLPSLKTMNVRTDGNAPSMYAFNDTGKTHTDMGWTTQQFFFTAAGALTTLQFLSTTDSTYYGPALDNVRITEVTRTPVPEPTSLLFLGTGFLGLARRKLRR